MGKLKIKRETVVTFAIRNKICDDLIGHPEAYQVMSVLMRWQVGHFKCLDQLKNTLKCKRAYWTKASKILKELGYMKSVPHKGGGQFDVDTYFYFEPHVEVEEVKSKYEEPKYYAKPKKVVTSLENN